MKDPAKYPGIRWTSQTIYVDIDTGELIPKTTKIKGDYTQIKTTKDGTINKLKTKGHITYTIELRRNQQLKLF